MFNHEACGIAIGFTTKEVEKVYEKAIAEGAIAESPATVKPMDKQLLMCVTLMDSLLTSTPRNGLIIQ